MKRIQDTAHALQVLREQKTETLLDGTRRQMLKYMLLCRNHNRNFIALSRYTRPKNRKTRYYVCATHSFREDVRRISARAGEEKEGR